MPGRVPRPSRWHRMRAFRVCAIPRRALDRILRHRGAHERARRIPAGPSAARPAQRRPPRSRPPAFPRPQQRPAPPPSFPPSVEAPGGTRAAPAPATARACASARRSRTAASAGEPPSAAGAELPDRGWRRILRLLTFGLVNLGPPPAQLEDAQFEAAIRTGFRGNHKVGVLGKGGVGKTSVAASVGSLFAELRHQDHVVAIDADTAFGRLSSRIDPRSTSSFWELTADKNLESFTDVSRPGGPQFGRPACARRRAGVRSAAGTRSRDLPRSRARGSTAISRSRSSTAVPRWTHRSPRRSLRDLDALIVVSSPWADGASAAARTMEWLAEQGMTALLHTHVVVLNDSDGHADKRTRAAAGPRVRRSRTAGGAGALRPASATRRCHRREPRDGPPRRGANFCRPPR